MRILILAASPRAGGTSDTGARIFAAGAEEEGAETRFLPLRGRRIRPCEACGACDRPPHACPLADGDDAEAILSEIRDADLVLAAAPVHFYGLPAHAKALVDRAQRFWRMSGPPEEDAPPALGLFVAGRPRGDSLFVGMTLGLKHFFRVLGRELVETREFRGMESASAWDSRPGDGGEIRRWGREWARRLRDRR